MLRKLAWLLLFGCLCSLIGEYFGLVLPTVSWPFEVARSFAPVFHGGKNLLAWLAKNFGWISCFLGIFTATGFLFSTRKQKPTPISTRRFQRFKAIKRGYYSYLILLFLILLAGLDQLLVGNRALVVRYEGSWYFPAFQQALIPGKTFGLTGENSATEPNYRDLKLVLENPKNQGDSKNFALMPPVPYAPTGDTATPANEQLVLRDALLYKNGENQPHSGTVVRLWNAEKSIIHLRARVRNGQLEGAASGFDQTQNRVYTAIYKNNKALSETYGGAATKEEFLAAGHASFYTIYYHPAPPMKSGHWLGTTSQGYDILAYLYGGLQLNIKAAMIYLPLVYLIGISIGLFSGFFGGLFDIIIQRLIEIFSNIPFLFIIIIIGSLISPDLKTLAGLGMILGILILFSWMGLSFLMRTSALKEKSRDYVLAARVLGASTPRIIFKHILPNTIAVLVTLIPFSISGVILSLTSLDYLGFGLPGSYASWGQLLSDGLANLVSPWIVTSAFCGLFFTLLLVTFVGEAIREAYDPKKFTIYQ